MTAPIDHILYGTSVDSSLYIPSGKEPRIIFRDKNTGHAFAFDEVSIFKNILLLGCAGSGKTNVLNQIVAQIRNWNDLRPFDGISFIFDTKGDYINHRGFYRNGDYIIGNDPRFRERSSIWNIFDEILADGNQPIDYEANARELASILFKDRGSKTQPFFANAARDIFANMMIYFIRRHRDNRAQWNNMLNNYDFISFLLNKTPEEFSKYFQIYPDMRGLVSYIGDGSSNQALGVFGELRSMIYDCFQGIFLKKPSSKNESFSIRKAIRNKGGRAIYILYDLSIGETMTPIYRLLVDLALKEALGESSNGHTHIFLDELKLLPKVTHLEDALNFGRSKKVSVVAGIQNVGQIYSIYGKELGQVILSGFGSVITLKTSDFESREYISQLFGPNLCSYRYHTESDEPVDNVRDGRTVEHWDLQTLQKPGQAIVGLSSQETPFFFDFEEDRF